MLLEKLERLPSRPGVYLFRDGEGDVLYVGKARSLRDRVRSYFGSPAGQGPKTRELVRRSEDVETIVVGSEAEALILEANLIKEHRPRFNVQLRDDKRYPYIKVTLQEPFPRVYVTRRVEEDGARYFGPYSSVGPMRRALRVVKKLYGVRSCRYGLPDEAPSRPCLDHQIGRCAAPCVGRQSEDEYRAMIEEVVNVLEGEIAEIEAGIEKKMRDSAEALDFERAAHFRDVLRGLRALAREQRVHKVGGGDHDVVGIARDGPRAAGVVLRVRDGVLLDRLLARFSQIEDEEDEALLSTFAAQAFLGGGEKRLGNLPGEILLPRNFGDRSLLQEALSREAGRKVRLRVPRRGDKARLVDLAEANARHALEDRLSALADTPDRADEALYELQDRLDLKVVPRRIVAFDISHTQGSETVGSAVFFEHGEPKKAGYRHMKVRSPVGNDDYRSLEEVVTRYFRRQIDEDGALPDLVLVDGGRGQVASARRALEDLDLADVRTVGLAKRREEIFVPGREEPIRLGRGDRALHLLQRVRDEAHRFAISYNRKLRKRRTIQSELGRVPGIGPQRQQALLSRFGSVRAIREATTDEIARVPGFSDILASRVLTYLGA